MKYAIQYSIIEGNASNGYHAAELAGKKLLRSVPLKASDRCPSTTEQCQTLLSNRRPSTAQLQKEGFFIIARL